MIMTQLPPPRPQTQIKPTSNRFKRIYLQGASNRLKSMKEEREYASLWAEKRGKTLIHKQDQQIRIRNLPLPKSPQNNENLPPHKPHSSLEITINDDKYIEIAYNATPVVRRMRQISHQHKNKTEHIPISNTSPINREIFANSIQLTSYAAINPSIVGTPLNSTKKHIPKITVPTSMDAAKKYLMQYS